jgi:hypothetical protein
MQDEPIRGRHSDFRVRRRAPESGGVAQGGEFPYEGYLQNSVDFPQKMTSATKDSKSIAILAFGSKACVSCIGCVSFDRFPFEAGAVLAVWARSGSRIGLAEGDGDSLTVANRA